MAKVAKIVAVVAGAVALAATGVGLVMGSGFLIAGVSVGTIAAAASAISTVAGMAAGAMQKKPKAQGSVSQVVIGMNLPVPYAMGRTYVGGMQIYDNSGGGEKNPWRYQINVVSAGGPIQGITNFLVDYADVPVVSGGNVAGWYSGFMMFDQRWGYKPDTAIGLGWAHPGWGPAHQASGIVLYEVGMKFDKDQKRFASGVPQFGVVGQMVKTYDPRRDSTYPGGAGSNRWDDENTFEFSENPASHAVTYARGRFENGKKVVGIGFNFDAIDMPSAIEWANVCDANGWKVGGVIYEQPGQSKWDNLKRICQAGGCQPVFSNGILSFRFFAPRPALFNITADDLAGPVRGVSAKPWRDRINTVVPRYREEHHNWEYVQLKQVQPATYLSEDKTPRTKEVQFDLVQQAFQATQLAAYEIVNARELGPLTLDLKPRLVRFHVGECGIINIPDAGLVNQKVIITGKQFQVESAKVTMTFETETAAKHPYALGQTNAAPSSPGLRTSEELDTSTSESILTTTDVTQLILASHASQMSYSVSPTGVVTISPHQQVYPDKTVNVSGATINTGGTPGQVFAIYYDDPTRSGGNVSYQYLVLPAGSSFAQATTTPSNPYRYGLLAGEIPPVAAGTVYGNSMF